MPDLMLPHFCPRCPDRLLDRLANEDGTSDFHCSSCNVLIWLDGRTEPRHWVVSVEGKMLYKFSEMKV